MCRNACSTTLLAGRDERDLEPLQRIEVLSERAERLSVLASGIARPTVATDRPLRETGYHRVSVWRARPRFIRIHLQRAGPGVVRVLRRGL
jgi:hypothetical protein